MLDFNSFDPATGFQIRDYSVGEAYVPRVTPRSEMSIAWQTIQRVISDNPELKSELEEWLMLAGIEAKRRETAPMPRDPAAIQVSIWDNWLSDKPRKSHPHRYKASIKVWSDDKIDFHDRKQVAWESTAKLMDPQSLAAAATKALAKRGNRYPISEAYVRMIDDACAMMTETGQKGGMLECHPHGGGTLRHDRQMIVADAAAIDRGDTSAEFVIWVDDATPIFMPAFSPTNAAGKPLGRRVEASGAVKSACVMQARYARDARRFAHWVTR